MKKLKLSKELSKLWKSLRKQPPPVQTGVWLAVLVAVVAIFYLFFSLAYLGRVYPQVSVGGVSFGGLTISQTEAALNQLISDNSGALTLRHSDHSQKLSQQEIDWRYNIKKTAEDIYNVGRNRQSRLKGFAEQLLAPLIVQRVVPTVTYDQQALDVAVSTFAEVVDKPALDATADYSSGELKVTKEKIGTVINQQEVKNSIISAWAKFFGSTITIQTYFDAPKVVLGDIDQLRRDAAGLAERQLRLTWPGQSRDLSANQIKQLIGFVGGVPVASSDQITQKLLTAAFTSEQAKDYLQILAETVDQPAEEPRLIIQNGQLAIAAIAKEGKVIDINETADDIVAALTGSEKTPVVELTIVDQKPIITEDNLDKLGITERIGIGQTSFFGSPTNRIHNIKTGVSFLQSALIAPGKEFSTVGTLGEVDHTTGYLPELVIKENRTVPEFGGGLCQVSTTLFRSVLNAGLKVMERQNHSYRVSYYEPPVGLDATIYLPKPDFRFLNDTKHHILIQGRVVGNSVVFELWGTSDGRTAAVSTPKILSTTKPGEPIYADTDTLPKGEEKQIEKAHDGAVTIAYYTVTRDGKVINQQTFKSVYKAWPARFLVGTGPAKED